MCVKLFMSMSSQWIERKWSFIKIISIAECPTVNVRVSMLQCFGFTLDLV